MIGIPKSVASYYSGAPFSHKATLLEMRNRILEVIPGAEEIIKYKMPTFVVDGDAVVGLMVHKNHIGFYPYSGSIIQMFPNIESKYRTTKGALHIPIEKPMLKSEVKALIKARLALND
jgi:uncharacterized protein YdhG (YjbR/CyaY superfamily)